MEDAKKLIDEGGDWDRRNHLKVYHGLHLLATTRFRRAADLLLDTLSTFTAFELVSYNNFVVFTIIANALMLVIERFDQTESNNTKHNIEKSSLSFRHHSHRAMRLRIEYKHGDSCS